MEARVSHDKKRCAGSRHGTIDKREVKWGDLRNELRRPPKSRLDQGEYGGNKRKNLGNKDAGRKKGKRADQPRLVTRGEKRIELLREGNHLIPLGKNEGGEFLGQGR